MDTPLSLLSASPTLFLLWVLAIIISLTVHECAHALAGYLQGDRTAEQEGRLSLNPLRHIDLMGFVLLLVAGFGWAKSTPFNPYNLKNQKLGPILIALAGPLSNALMVLVFSVALWIVDNFTHLPGDNLMVMLFFLLIQINVMLGVFNLIPIPPLDGSRVLFWWLADKRPDIVQWLERYGMFVLFGLVFVFGGMLSTLFASITNTIFKLIG